MSHKLQPREKYLERNFFVGLAPKGWDVLQIFRKNGRLKMVGKGVSFSRSKFYSVIMCKTFFASSCLLKCK